MVAKKKALIIGANGSLGKYLMKDLAKKFQILGTYNSKKDDNLVYLDITDREKVARVIKDYNPNFIFLLAAMTNVEGCEKNKEKAFEINVSGVKNVVSNCGDKVKIIFISTDAVFDGSKEEYTETDSKNPQNVYGLTKSLAEDIVLTKKKSLVIRTSRLFGFDGNKFVNHMIKSLLNTKEVTVPEGNLGTPTFIPSLSEVILKVVLKDLSGIYHIVGSQKFSMPEIAQKIIKIFHLKDAKIILKDPKFFNSNVKRPSVLLSTKKLNNEGIFVDGLEDGLRKVKKKFGSRGFIQGS